MATVVLIPLEPSLPAIAGFTTPYIMFAILTGYIISNRPRALARTWIHPVFLAAFCLLIIGTLIESAHPFSSYSDIFRIGQMIVAGIFVASLCRDRRAVRAALHGFLIAGVLISFYLFLTFYGALRGAIATDYGEASKVRKQILVEAGVEATMKKIVLYPTLGAAVALALGLNVRSSLRRNLFFGIALFCIVATFLPMSRSGIVMVAVSCATVVFAYGVRQPRVILVAIALAVGALIWVPGVVYSRLTFTPETREGGRLDSRTQIYKAALDHLPEYVLTGVGAGNFWGPWGLRSGFLRPSGVDGAHNAFIQVTLNWGLAALLVLSVVVYLTYRCLPRGGGKDVVVLSLYGIAVALLLQMMVSHVLTGKEFSLGLGLLVGGHRWIWPKGIIRSARRRQGRHYPAFGHAS
jgi:hypothetical protein